MSATVGYSYSSALDDDFTPNRALDIAGQAVRDFNHRTLPGSMGDQSKGWRGAPGVYRALGEMGYLTGGLPQALNQMMSALVGQLEAKRIKMDGGEDPEKAVTLALGNMALAVQLIEEARGFIGSAQSAIFSAGMTNYEPLSDDEDD